MNELRKIFKIEDDKEKRVNLSEIKKGDTFKMFEPDGTPVKNNEGKTIFVAEKDAEFDSSIEQWGVVAK